MNDRPADCIVLRGRLDAADTRSRNWRFLVMESTRLATVRARGVIDPFGAEHRALNTARFSVNIQELRTEIPRLCTEYDCRISLDMNERKREGGVNRREA